MTPTNSSPRPARVENYVWLIGLSTKLDKFNRDFLWGSNVEKRKVHGVDTTGTVSVSQKERRAKYQEMHGEQSSFVVEMGIEVCLRVAQSQSQSPHLVIKLHVAAPRHHIY